MFSSLSDIYNDIDLILEVYKNQKLTDKEQAIIVAVKKELISISSFFEKVCGI